MSKSSTRFNTPSSPPNTSSLAQSQVSLDRRFPITVFRKKYLTECSMKVVLGRCSFATLIWKYAASASMQTHTLQSAPSCCLNSSTHWEDLWLISNQPLIQPSEIHDQT